MKQKLFNLLLLTKIKFCITSILISDIPCSAPPVPQHGTLNCANFESKSADKLEVEVRCRLACQKGYVLNAHMGIPALYTCKQDAMWEPEFPKAFTNWACVSKYIFVIFSKYFILSVSIMCLVYGI